MRSILLSTLLLFGCGGDSELDVLIAEQEEDLRALAREMGQHADRMASAPDASEEVRHENELDQLGARMRPRAERMASCWGGHHGMGPMMGHIGAIDAEGDLHFEAMMPEAAGRRDEEARHRAAIMDRVFDMMAEHRRMRGMGTEGCAEP
jgi:hypothetical protein